jgi:iron(III) transport system substrate-binding protein
VITTRLATLLTIVFFTASCAPAATPSPTAAPAKPTEAAKPAAEAKPAASPAAAAPAAKPAASPAASPAAAAGPTDRADVDAAKREGTVVWYTSTPLSQAEKVAQAFEAKYGFKVEVFRTGGEQVIQRFLTEVSAGRIVVDLLTASDPGAFNDMVKKNQLVKFRPEHFDKVPQTARNEEGYWVAQRLNLITMAFRSDRENEAEMPKKWADSADPKYKGKQVHADPSFTAVANGIVATLTRDPALGWGYYEALKKNDMMIVQGHQQLAQILSTGERTIGAEVADNDMFDLKRKGIAIKSVYPEDGSFVIPAPTGIVTGSPHPAAAKLLAEFMLSDDAQKLFPQEGFYAGRSDMPPPEGNPPLSSLKLIPIDEEYVQQNSDKIKQRFNEIFSS